ncbi:MAG: glycosyl hydrolase family 18 protein [Terriglobus sp.]
MISNATALRIGAAAITLAATSIAHAQPTKAAQRKEVKPRHTEPADSPEIVGYFPQWAIYNRRYIPIDLIHSGAIRSITQLDYAQANIRDNACVVADPLADINMVFKAEDSIDGVADDPATPLRGNFRQLQLLRQLYPKLRVLISIEGKTDLFVEAAKPENRAAFVHSCIARFLEGHIAPGIEAKLFDGIDVDWEYPGADDAENFYALMAEFRRQMDAIRWKSTALRAGTTQRGYTLSIAAGAAQKHIQPINWKTVAQSVDQIGVMTYDFNGPWSRDTGFTAPLASSNPRAETVTTTITAFLNGGAPAKQLLLGIPFYAYQWKNVTPGTSYGLNSKGDPVHGNLNQSTAATMMQSPNAQLHRDPLSHAPWIFDGNNFLTFEDAVSLKAKRDYVHQLGMGGYMIWELSGDTNDAQLLRALAAPSAHSTTPTADGGTAP